MTQALSLREQLSILEGLQELDLKIENLKKRKMSLPAELKTVEDIYQKASRMIQIKKNAVVEIEKIQKQTQAAVDLNNDRSTRASQKLESVQNSQEFQAANKEIDQLKKLNTSLDEQLKKAKLDMDTLQADIAKMDENYQKTKEDRDAKLSVVSGQEQELDSEIKKLLGERGQLTPKVEQRLLGQYDRIRVARAGVGLVPAVGGRCSGCNMVVPPQLYNEIQKAIVVHQCPSCFRILYAPMKSPATQSAAHA